MTPVLVSDLDRSWVVEASAGTGKTTALVDRMVEASTDRKSTRLNSSH